MKVNKLFEEKKRVINRTKGYVPTTMNNAIFLTVGLHDSIQYIHCDLYTKVPIMSVVLGGCVRE